MVDKLEKKAVEINVSVPSGMQHQDEGALQDGEGLKKKMAKLWRVKASVVLRARVILQTGRGDSTDPGATEQNPQTLRPL